MPAQISSWPRGTWLRGPRNGRAHEASWSPGQGFYCGRLRSRLRDERGIIGRFEVGCLARTGWQS